MPTDNSSISNFFNNATSINNNYPQIYAPLFAAASNLALFNATSSTASTSTFGCPTVTSSVNSTATSNLSKYQQQITALEQQNNFNQQQHQQQQQFQLQRQLLAVAAFKQQFAAALSAASMNSSPSLNTTAFPNSISKVEISPQNLN